MTPLSMSTLAAAYLSLGSVAVFFLGVVVGLFVIPLRRNASARKANRRRLNEALKYVDHARGIDLDDTVIVAPQGVRE